MPTTQTALLGLDNLLDTIVQYPAAVLSPSSEAVGREALHVADYRRERSWWSPTAAAANTFVAVDLGAGNTANVDFLWLDRSHNLASKTVHVEYADTLGGAWTQIFSGVVPAVGAAVGGDPSAGLILTEEGSCYVLFAPAGAAHRCWRVLVVDNMLPNITGAIIGTRTQLAGYSNIYDDDEGDRKFRSEESDAGYVATGRIYAWRLAHLDLSTIGAPQYDGQMRQIRRFMFEQGAPAFLCENWGTYSARTGLFRHDGPKWSFPTKGVYRAGVIPLREVGAVVL